MKTSTYWITAGCAAMMLVPAFSLEAPADNAPPPPAADKPANLPDYPLNEAPARPNAVRAAASTAFLGVVSGDLPSCLIDHLGLEKSGGILVRSLVPEGPAAKAGLTINDVIVSIAGNPIASPEDISRLISSHKPGDSVSLDLIHKGQRTKLDVVLGNRPAELTSVDPMVIDPMHLDSLPKDLADRIRAAIAGNVGGMEMKPGAGVDDMPAEIEAAMREMQRRMEGAINQGGLKLPDSDPAAGGNVETKSSATFMMQDEAGSVQVKSTDGAKTVTIRDRSNNVIWSGPWNSEADKAAAPPEARNRMQGVDLDPNFQGKGLRFGVKPGKVGR